MKVELLHNTPLWVASKAIRKCWASEDKSDTEDEVLQSDINQKSSFVKPLNIVSYDVDEEM